MQQEELPNKVEGEQPRGAGADQNKVTGLKQQAGTGNGENAETNTRTEMPRPEEAGEEH